VQQSYKLLAARYLRKQAKQLRARLDGIRRADDIEDVHQARVASRRLRAAIALFRGCFGRKKMKRWRKQIERVTDQLGAARDKDVHSEYLCHLMAQAPPQAYPGVARLLVHVEKQRARLQDRVVSAVDRLERSGVLGEMRRASKRILSKGNSDAAGPGMVVFGEIRRHVVQQLEELCAYEDGLQHSEDQERHHAMRIAAKSLRYTLEIAAPIYAGGLDEPIRAVKNLQTLLGQIHDCDVWLDELDEFAAAERRKIVARYASDAPFARLEPGIEFVRQERQQCRQSSFTQLVACWQRLDQQGLWKQLMQTLDAPLGRKRAKKKDDQPPASEAAPDELVSEPGESPKEASGGRAAPERPASAEEPGGRDGSGAKKAAGRATTAPGTSPRQAGRSHAAPAASGRHGAAVG